MGICESSAAITSASSMETPIDNNVSQKARDLDRAFKLKIMGGDLNAISVICKRMLRVFISSTFKDSVEERNYLMEHIFPKLRTFCQSHGIEFIPVDLRWGIGNNILSDYRVTDVCLAEVDRCFEDSIIGPCFVFLSFNRYGSQPLPRLVRESEFNSILDLITEPSERSMVRSCYQIDTNAIPAEYCLKSQKEQLQQFPDRLSEKEKLESWNKKRLKVHEIIRNVLEHDTSFTEEAKIKWRISVTEKEVRKAVEKREGVSDRCFAIVRDIILPQELKNGEDFEEKSMKTFVDNCNKERERLRALIDVFRMPKDYFSVEWHAAGITPSSHGDYFKQFGEAFQQRMECMISDALGKVPRMDSLTAEVAAHLSFCSERTNSFFGRQSLLTSSLQYLKRHSGGNELFVVFGASGSGKTSLMAKLTESAYRWFSLHSASPVIVVRFCGTSPESSTAASIMKSICEQINFAFNVPRQKPVIHYGEQIERFRESLELASSDRPLVILIDSLDQLSNVDKGRSNLVWLPAQLPPHVYFIVSTVTGFGGCMESLQAKELAKQSFLEVTPINDEDCELIFDSWMTEHKRQLTPEQRSLILSIAKDKTKEPPSTIRLRLLYRISRRWPSSKKVIWLPIKTVDLISKFLDNVEEEYGPLFVSVLFGLLDTSKRGLCESDLRDILSCDGSVLEEVLKENRPPILRIPQVVMSRLRHRFGEYIVERGAYGKRVWAWYHRQFWETAHKRYIKEELVVQHAEKLRKFFSGELAEEFKQRNIAKQPLQWVRAGSDQILYNEQKLQELPWAALRSVDPYSAEKILCNFHFIITKMQAGFAEDLLRDFGDALRLAETPRLKEYEQYLSHVLKTCTLDPNEVIQHALKYPEDSCVYQGAKNYCEKG